MFKAIAVIAAAAAAVSMTAPAQAADPVKGKLLYDDNCAACHGDTGVSEIPIYPNLAGQKEQYLDQQLKAFRSGTRKDDTMQPMAQGLSSSDIAHIALYLSRLRPGR